MIKEKFLKKIAKLEADNQHSLYMKEVALYFDDINTAQKFELIKQIQDLEFSLDPFLNLYKQQLFNDLRIRHKDKCIKLNMYVPERVNESLPKLVY